MFLTDPELHMQKSRQLKLINAMKSTIKTKPMIIYAAALCAAVLAGPNANANPSPVTGSIGFSATGVIVNSPNLSTASSFSLIAPVVSDPTGTYTTVPLNTPVEFNGFVFNPPVASITPLWTFEIGSTVYSFDATTDSSSFNSTLDEWDIGGKGMAMVTGYAPTIGTWNVNLSQSGDSFVFDSSAAATGPAVADGGSSLACLGGAFLGLSILRRKMRA
jgi:hypothetical protein